MSARIFLSAVAFAFIAAFLVTGAAGEIASETNSVQTAGAGTESLIWD